LATGCYGFPARLEPDEEGRLVVHFPDLPEALTDGADEAEALAEAADCLSEALAGRINRGEDIPPPSRLRRGQHWVSPDPIMALKAALYSALRARKMPSPILPAASTSKTAKQRASSTRVPPAA
jgi:antitoxin HicB